MGWQTLESLRERKLDNWLKKGVITKAQYKDIIVYCVEYGFWRALGYATRLKYKNHPELQKKYIYKWINIPRKECLLRDYVTTGKGLSNQKRHRIWRNIYFNPDGTHKEELIKEQNPGWEIFYMRHNKFRVGLRKPIP